MRIDGRSSDDIRRSLVQADGQLRSSREKHASGPRIRDAADDTTGLSRSEQLRALIQSFDSINRNTTDGIQLARAAESALGGLGETVSRMRQLTVQATKGTLTASDRANLRSEFSQLSKSIDQVADSTEFNGRKLFNGSQSDVTIQAGPVSCSEVRLQLPKIAVDDLGLDQVDLGSSSAAGRSLHAIDAALASLHSSRADFGFAENRLASHLFSNVQTRANLLESESRIRDVDYALESLKQVQASIIQQGAAAIYTQESVSRLSTAQLLE